MAIRNNISLVRLMFFGRKVLHRHIHTKTMIIHGRIMTVIYFRLFFLSPRKRNAFFARQIKALLWWNEVNVRELIIGFSQPSRFPDSDWNYWTAVANTKSFHRSFSHIERARQWTSEKSIKINSLAHIWWKLIFRTKHIEKTNARTMFTFQFQKRIMLSLKFDQIIANQFNKYVWICVHSTHMRNS